MRHLIHGYRPNDLIRMISCGICGVIRHVIGASSCRIYGIARYRYRDAAISIISRRRALFGIGISDRKRYSCVSGERNDGRGGIRGRKGRHISQGTIGIQTLPAHGLSGKRCVGVASVQDGGFGRGRVRARI